MQTLSRCIVPVLCGLVANPRALAAPIIQQQQAAALRKAAGGGGYTYYSTAFDGSADYLTRGAGLTGAADGQTGVISVWVKLDGGSSNTAFYGVIWGGNFAVGLGRDNAGKMSVAVQTSAPATVLFMASNANSVINSSGWTHVLAAWDLSTAGRRYIFINGSDQTNVTTFTSGTTADYTQSNWEIGSGSGGQSKIFGLMCELYMSLGNAWFDISDSGNRSKFRTAAGKPESLGADGSTPEGVQPIVYLKNVFSTFETNLGSGGGFTENGTLGDGGGDIP